MHKFTVLFPFRFFWMSTGKPMTYENWNAGEPNNFQYENGEQEHCLELWNRDGKVGTPMRSIHPSFAGPSMERHAVLVPNLLCV